MDGHGATCVLRVNSSSEGTQHRLHAHTFKERRVDLNGAKEDPGLRKFHALGTGGV